MGSANVVEEVDDEGAWPPFSLYPATLGIELVVVPRTNGVRPPELLALRVGERLEGA
jgi:hypothetical protein